CDCAGGGGAVYFPSQPVLQRLLPDRAADGKADETRHPGLLPQPVLDLGVAGSTAENDAGDPVATGASGLVCHPSVVLASVEAFDLPDLRLDVGRLQFGDGPNNQLRPDF